MNLITRLELELAFYDVAVHHVSHYTTENPSEYLVNQKKIIEIDSKLFYNRNSLEKKAKWFVRNHKLMEAFQTEN